jgi:hypothetical protein
VKRVAQCATLRKRVTASYPRGKAINKPYPPRLGASGDCPSAHRANPAMTILAIHA